MRLRRMTIGDILSISNDDLRGCPQPAKRSLRAIARLIVQNCRDLSRGKISCAEHAIRNRALWDEVYQGEPNVIGSPASRRDALVCKYLQEMDE